MPENILTFQELESYWRDLRPPQLEVSVSHKTPIEEQIAKVRATAIHSALKQFGKDYDGKVLTIEMLTAISATVICAFMEGWYEQMKHHDLGYLVEVIIESQQDLPISDIKGFIRALPMTILSRLLNDSKGQMTGLHALIACEVRRREGELSDYDIRVDMNRKLIVTFTPPPDPRNPTGGPMEFILRDIFGARF